MSSSLFESRMKKLLESELVRACSTGNKEAIAQLVDDKGVALDCIDEENDIGLQPLMIACKRGHFDIVQYLLWHNTDILDNYDSAGWSSLHWSVLNGHYLITKELIEFGADLDLKSFSDNIYPIHLSIFSNKPSICKLLLDNNCKIDILYNNMYNINELLDYIQFKLKLLNMTQINRFKNIIFNSKQYKDLQNKLNKNQKYNNNSDTDIEIILDDDTLNDNEFNLNDDDEQFKQIKKKYFNNESDSDSDSSTSSSDNEIENENDIDDVNHIMSLLPQTENDILDLGNDAIIEENNNEIIASDGENNNDNEFSKQLQIKETETEIEMETLKEKQIEKQTKQEQNEVINGITSDEKDLEINEINKKSNMNDFISNGIISINLNALSEQIYEKLSEKFVNKNEFKEFNAKQLSFNTMFKEEQSKSLKEIIDLNKEINSINNNVNNNKTEFKNEISNIKTECDNIIDNKLTKYEEWLRLNIEDKIDKNMNDIQSFQQTLNELKVKINKINAFIKTHQTKQPSIETLKVGKIIEMELKKKTGVGNVNKKQKQKQKNNKNKKYKKQKQKHMKSQSLKESFTPTFTPTLNQSFSAMDNNNINIEALRLETDSSISNDEQDSDINDEINIYQNIINIQQNIFSQSKKKKRIKTLQLEKNRHSAPSILPSINSMSKSKLSNGSINHDSEGIFATVEMPIVLDESNKMKPKNLRRKRSNSYSSESPRITSPKKHSNNVNSGGYWE